MRVMNKVAETWVSEPLISVFPSGMLTDVIFQISGYAAPFKIAIEAYLPNNVILYNAIFDLVTKQKRQDGIT